MEMKGAGSAPSFPWGKGWKHIERGRHTGREPTQGAEGASSAGLSWSFPELNPGEGRGRRRCQRRGGVCRGRGECVCACVHVCVEARGVCRGRGVGAGVQRPVGDGLQRWERVQSPGRVRRQLIRGTASMSSIFVWDEVGGGRGDQGHSWACLALYRL